MKEKYSIYNTALDRDDIYKSIIKDIKSKIEG